MEHKTNYLKLLIISITCLLSFNGSAQQSISGSFSSNGNTRNFLGAVPQNPQDSMRLVILLCDANERASDMEGRGFNNYLGSNTMVIYPEPQFFMGGFLVDTTNNVDDFQMIEDLIAHIDSNYSINLSDICLGGRGFVGGSFCYELVCEFNDSNSMRPYSFKAFAVTSAEMRVEEVNLSYCPVTSNVPLIAFHGTEELGIRYNGDTVIFNSDTIYISPVETTVDFWATQVNGCQANPSLTVLPDSIVESPLPSTVELLEYNCNNCTNTKLYRIVGCRNGWPGSALTIDNLSGGNNYDVSATKLIAEFFECSNTNLSQPQPRHRTQAISVYPNPAKDILNVSAPGRLKLITIYKSNAEKISTSTSAASQVSLAGLNPGLYFIRVETDSENTVLRFLKQ